MTCFKMNFKVNINFISQKKKIVGTRTIVQWVEYTVDPCLIPGTLRFPDPAKSNP